jgi:hypothetical protein
LVRGCSGGFGDRCRDVFARRPASVGNALTGGSRPQCADMWFLCAIMGGAIDDAFAPPSMLRQR